MATNAFEFFIERKNAKIVRLLEQNHDVAGAIQGLLEHLVDHAEEKGVPFHQIVLDNLHVTRDNHVVARVLTKR